MCPQRPPGFSPPTTRKGGARTGRFHDICRSTCITQPPANGAKPPSVTGDSGSFINSETIQTARTSQQRTQRAFLHRSQVAHGPLSIHRPDPRAGCSRDHAARHSDMPAQAQASIRDARNRCNRRGALGGTEFVELEGGTRRSRLGDRLRVRGPAARRRHGCRRSSAGKAGVVVVAARLQREGTGEGEHPLRPSRHDPRVHGPPPRGPRPTPSRNASQRPGGRADK